MSINHAEGWLPRWWWWWGGLYLGGDGAAEQYGVAEVEGGGVGEDAQPVPAVRRHAEGAVPLVQGEEERREVQRDEDAHPHGPVQGPHEGADGGGGVPTPDLRRCHTKAAPSVSSVGLCFHFIAQRVAHD